MTPTSPGVPAATVAALADVLVGVESSQSLLASLEELLGAAAALPARLYLYDANQHVFYPAAGFGCERGEEEIEDPATDASLRPGHYALRSHGEWVGQLEVLAASYDQAQVTALCHMLGPVLVSVHRQTRTIDELQLVRAEAAQFISAGNLLRHLDVEILLVRILEMVMGSVRAQVGAVLTADEAGRLTVRVALGLREEHVRAIRFTSGGQVAEHVLTQGEPLCLDASQVLDQLDLTGLGAILFGLLVLPLTTRDRTQGVVMLANPESPFAEGEQRIAETVCGMAAIALDNALLVKSTVDRERLKREMDLAHSVQEQMYPKSGLAAGVLHIEGYSRPCDETGGDYYSFLSRGDRLLTMIGDVSGHGLGAALYTTMAHAVIQQQLRAGVALEPSFAVLNEALFHTQSGRFMTAALIEVEPATLEFRYISAGHNPLLWISAGQPRWLESCGMPLGIVPVAEFPPACAGRLAPGDCLILYTDGFTEAINSSGEFYGEERLAQAALRGVADRLGPSAMIRLLAEDVDRWANGKDHEDDLTIVVITVDR